MPPSEPSRVFISYARKDGAALAQRLQKDLNERGFDAWLDALRIGGGRVWSLEVEGAIKSSGVMIALLSPGAYESEICRSEQLLALDQGNRVIPVLAVKDGDRPIYLYARQYRDFTDDANYSASLGELLADIRGDATATLPDTYRKTRVTYLTAPPRISNYLERPKALRALRDALFAEDHRQPIALTAVHGMGGVGKTVLAKALTDDEVVQRAFPDGIVWITAGKERKRDFIDEMREVAKALGDDLSGYDTTLACEHQYRTTIANKAALIVVDDVWSKSDIEPLLAESPRSRFLFTTRDAAIGRFVGAHDHRADLLDMAQSRALLAEWADLAVAKLPVTADEIVRECGRLPLALSVLGAMLRGEDAEFWMDTLNLLRRADISAIDEQLPPGQVSFYKSVEISFRFLTPEMQERYRALAVLLEDMAAPLPILEMLWNLDAAEARRVSRHFVDRSLALRGETGENIRLHDLQLDYARYLYPDREALNQIHEAVRQSTDVIAKDPSQFASQVVGRLLPFGTQPGVMRFLERLYENAPHFWIRPLYPTLTAPAGELFHALVGHAGSVCCVALSGDGRLAVSASEDKTLKVWDVERGRELRTLEGHSDVVTGVALSKDGRLAVSASEDRTLKVWDVERGRELHTLQSQSAFVSGVALSWDGRIAVSATREGTVTVWDADSGREVRTLHTGGASCLALSADAQTALCPSGKNTLEVWNLRSGFRVRTLHQNHSGEIQAVAVSWDGRLGVSASSDHTLQVWNVLDFEIGCELRTLEGHSDVVTGVALSGDGQLAVSASRDGTLSLWDVDSGRKHRTLTAHTRWVNGVALSTNGRLAVSASEDKTLKVWHVERSQGLEGVVNWTKRMFRRRERRTLQGHTGRVLGLALSEDGRLAVSASEDKTLKVWDVDSGRELRTLNGHTDFVTAVAVTPDGRLAVSASVDKTLKVWKVASGRKLRTLTGHSSNVYAVALSRDGQLAVSASRDGMLKVWAVASGRQLHEWASTHELVGHDGPVFGVALSGDGRLAVSASGGRLDHTLKVWEVGSGHKLRELAGHDGPVLGVALSEDGRLAVSASRDKTLKVWEVESGRALVTLKGHARDVYAVALSRDRLLAVSASYDKTLKVWDLGAGKELGTFTCENPVFSCAYCDAQKLILAGDDGGHVHFLRLEEPKAKG